MVDIYIYYTYICIIQVRYFPGIYCCYVMAIQSKSDRLMILLVT